MEGSGTGISRLDCYEDMFKEITRKLYGEDPDHRTSSVQNEFETSVSYKNEEDTGNGTDGSDDGNWTCEEEPLKGTDGSRIAAYHAGKATWKCYECGDMMAGGPRDVTEHFMELHSSRILADDSRNEHHSPRKDYLQSELKVEDVISYLEKLRERAERGAPPSRRTQETQTVPASLLPVTSPFLLQELPSTPAPQHLHQNATTTPTPTTVSASGKRYTCPYCPYGTDRRDLYTRHENIHREEKPFHCYICYKPFNRADHVKKHFLRMHREHGYELSRIRRPVGSNAPKPVKQETGNTGTGNATTNAQQQQQQPQQQQQQQQSHANYTTGFNNNKNYQLQPNSGTNPTTNIGGIYQGASMPTSGIMQPDANCTTGRRMQNGGCNSKSHLKGGAKSGQERRYTCCYCSWSGLDNWCLKRHLNTHLKPFACTLCEYKAARPERLATHVLKVHNRRQCSRCSFLSEDATQLQLHQLHVHRISTPSANPTTSTPQVTPPPNNRHQQPLHPAGGGRPPPGPPVFPASSPAIAPATTVIPPTTILGAKLSSLWKVIFHRSKPHGFDDVNQGGPSFTGTYLFFCGTLLFTVSCTLLSSSVWCFLVRLPIIYLVHGPARILVALTGYMLAAGAFTFLASYILYREHNVTERQRQRRPPLLPVIALLSICTVFLTCCAGHAIFYRKSAYSGLEGSETPSGLINICTRMGYLATKRLLVTN